MTNDDKKEEGLIIDHYKEKKSYDPTSKCRQIDVCL
jgi:hypothetical protein